MTDPRLHQLFTRFKSGALSEEELLQQLSSRMYESLGFATVDHHREMRQGR